MFQTKMNNKTFVNKRNSILSNFKKSLTELQSLVKEVDVRQKQISEEKSALEAEERANNEVKDLSLHSVNALLNILEPTKKQ